MSSRRRIPYHTLGEKLNLVSLPDGRDLYRCVRCGHKVKTALRTSNRVPGGCLVSQEDYAEWQAEQQEKVVELVRKPLGWWSNVPVAKATCSKCESKAELVPRKGHRLSEFWQLERDDGCELVWCPKGCTEG